VTIENAVELKKVLKINGYSNKAVHEIVAWYVSNNISN
jgi:hypothetical protein